MTVAVSIITPTGLGSINAPGIGKARVKEILTVPSTTAASLLSGEIFMVSNGEAADVLVATGTTPDAQAAASTVLTTAGMPASVGVPLFYTGNVGDRLNVKVMG